MTNNEKIEKFSGMSEEEQIIVQDIKIAAQILLNLTEEFSNEQNDIDKINLMSKYILERANTLCAAF